MSREERREQISTRAREERLRRSLRHRWERITPIVSTSGAQLRLSPTEKKVALASDGTLAELEGACLLDARTVTFDRPAQPLELATVDGVRVRGAGSASAGPEPEPREPVREAAIILVRVNLEMQGFEVLDFPIWSRGQSRPTDEELRRAYASADELVRRCLSVR